MTETDPSSTMTLTDQEVEAEAILLDEAEATATQVRQTTSVYPAMTIADAYRVQAAWRDLKLARGERVVGHKIGLTSRAMQAAMNITTPDSGFLTDRMVFEPDSTMRAAAFCDPKLEVELAFVLAEDLAGEDLDIDDVLDATATVSPAIELIAARSHRRDPGTGRTRTVVDTIADNAADAGIICGPSTIGPRDVDLRWVGALAYRNKVVEETGLAAGVLDHPARGIVWLARRCAAQGLLLEAGQIVLAGSFTRPIDIRPGDRFHVDYGPLGSFGVNFE
ncbi:MAG: 2-oxo-hepta-3-ene-1,7-dioic acid hydratase [Acidimicrobiia bacterium]|nr:2-oxo-hepta-3-ene-1,7-dioic acid hydratase [Acidimicrobiia bacterium]